MATNTRAARKQVARQGLAGSVAANAETHREKRRGLVVAKFPWDLLEENSEDRLAVEDALSQLETDLSKRGFEVAVQRQPLARRPRPRAKGKAKAKRGRQP